jgi:hypothetical protein
MGQWKAIFLYLRGIHLRRLGQLEKRRPLAAPALSAINQLFS